MFYVSLVWVVCGVISLAGAAFLIKKGVASKAAYLLGIFALVPVLFFGITIIEQNI
jgi:hypothetical protein